jgi:hypothetical protein
VVESPLPRLADLSLHVLEDFADSFEGPADVGAFRMESPAAHFSQFAPELSEAHLDIAQPAVNGSRPAEAAPALLGLLVRLISHDELLSLPPDNRLPFFPQALIFASGWANFQGSAAGCWQPLQ